MYLCIQVPIGQESFRLGAPDQSFGIECTRFQGKFTGPLAVEVTQLPPTNRQLHNADSSSLP